MKIKTIAGVVAAAVYTAGIAHAASAVSVGDKRLEAISISPEVIKARTEIAENLTYGNLLEGNGINVKLAPSVKFKAEEGLTGTHNYIIRLKSAPAALYQGDVKGQGATKNLFANQNLGPRTKNLKNEPAVIQYTNKLKQEQSSFVSKAQKAGITVKVDKQYQIALNAITAKLTQKEAEKLSKLPEVAFVSREKSEELLMDVAPVRTNVDHVWADTSFPQAPDGLKGEGMLIGIVDTGISTQHPSFAATGDDGYTVQNPLGTGNFLHDCEVEGQENLCNDKLIGVWSTEVITQANVDPEFIRTRPQNGEDYQGHGTHTASIAAGNVLYNVPHMVGAMDYTNDGIETGLTIPEMSGIAPHANIISYQACYPGQGADKWKGCPQTATVAAIEQAILDGVDVINYSISGGYDSHNDPVELAFLAAHEAGINVAASAGNSGAYQTVNHVSPWILSVASTQHGRTFNVDTTQRLENLSYSGTAIPASYRTDIRGITTSAVTGPMVLAANIGDEFCGSPFAPGTFTNGEIVFCARGNDIPLIDKSANVAAGGASAVVIYNTTDSSQDMFDTLPHTIPAMQMDRYDAPYMIDWLNDGDSHSGTIPATVTTANVNANYEDAISVFSSIGHAWLPEYRESTAPSIAAPGSNIYSAYSSDQPFTVYANPSKFSELSGTSMSSPHIAGALALIKQAQPEWSPSEVMSAMQLTANSAVGDRFGRPDLTNPWFYGSGIAQVDAAIASGLIMHVPAEDYTTANPYQGGNIGALNTPNMVDSACFRSCSWVREVTATVDGTWTAQGLSGEYSVNVEIQPSTFTLQAGETQRLIITGSWIDSRNALSSPRGLTVFGGVALTHENPDVPMASMNVEMVLDSGDLPEVVEFETHATESSNAMNNLSLGDAPELQIKAYKPAYANVEEVELVERANGNGSLLFEVAQDVEKVHVTWVDVPEGAKRLVAEVLESGAAINPNEYTSPLGNAGIYLGIDHDNDGIINYDSEVICKSVVSSYELKDWCNIPNPEAGTYWVVWQEHNFNSRSYLGFDDAIFKHKVATAVVMSDVSESITFDAPASSTPEEMSNVVMNTVLPDFVEGEKLYTAIDFGTDSNNAENVGLISVNLTRGIDELSMQTSANGARVGDVVDYKVSLLANTTGSDRNYNFTAQIPADLEIVEGSVRLSENRFLSAPEINIENGVITINGTQVDSRDLERNYIITNSIQDAMCRTPVGNGDYIDLNAYGFNPVEGAPASNTEAPLQLTLNEIYQDANSPSERFALYNYFEGSADTQSLYVHSNGMINITGQWHPTFGAGNMAYNDNFNPFYWANMGVFWHGAAGFGANGMQFGAPYSLDDNGDGVSGISFVKLVDQDNVGSHVVIEWDNMQHVQPDAPCGFRGCPPDVGYEGNPASSTKVDAQAIIARNYNSAPGAFEIVYAYDNLNFGYYTGNGSSFQEDINIENSATAGVIGFASPTAGQPLEGWIRQSIIPGYDGFGQLHNFLQDNMAICFDYEGPEVSAFDLHFQVRVKPSAIGQDHIVNVDAIIDGMETRSMMEMLKVQSNLTIYDIEDQSTSEETTIEGIQVAYMDNNNVSNTISVSGEGITAVVNGHANGSTFDLMPNKDFTGTTTVTVTVTDDHYATDAVSTSFMLTVSNTNDAPTAKGTSSSASEGEDVTLDASSSFDVDGDSLTYMWEGPGAIADATSAVTTVSGLEEGSHTFTLTVSDGLETSSTSVAVYVNPKPYVNSGGGSINLLLMLMALIGAVSVRRKTQ